MLVFVLLPGVIMGAFGAEFRTAVVILVVLSVGEFINVLAGPVGILLQMTGNEKTYRNCTFASAVAQLVLCLVLIPELGALGAAIATASAIVVTNGLSLIFAKRALGFIPSAVRATTAIGG